MLPYFFGPYWPIAVVLLILGIGSALKHYPKTTAVCLVGIVIIAGWLWPDWLQKPPCGDVNFTYKLFKQ